MNLKEYATMQEETKETIKWLEHEIKGEEEVVQGLREALETQKELLLKLQKEADFIRNQKEY